MSRDAYRIPLTSWATRLEAKSVGFIGVELLEYSKEAGPREVKLDCDDRIYYMEIDEFLKASNWIRDQVKETNNEDTPSIREEG